MDYPPYSPDIAPSDFYLFGFLKKHLTGKQFATDADMKQAVTSCLQILDTDFFYGAM
jgi:histone-lysine N-methyltransferase SETMAR